MAFLFPAATSTALATWASTATSPAITAPPELVKRVYANSDCRSSCNQNYLVNGNSCRSQSSSAMAEGCGDLYASYANGFINYSEYVTCRCQFVDAYNSCYSTLMITAGCEECMSIYDWRAIKSNEFAYLSCAVPTSLLQTSTSVQRVSGGSIRFVPETVEIMTKTPTTADASATTSTTSYRRTSTSTSYRWPQTFTYNTPADFFVSISCQEPHYTLVQDKTDVLWMAMAGCDYSRPECCAWNIPGYYGNAVVTSYRTLGGTADAESTTSTSTSSLTVTTPPHPYAIPTVPTTASNKVLGTACPVHFNAHRKSYCCPYSYSLFTRAIGVSTPCYSLGLQHTAPALVVTAGVAPSGTVSPVTVDGTVVTELATSAVGDLVFTTSYRIKVPLSTGQIAGIAVGAIAGALLLLGIGICFWRRRRVAKKRQQRQAWRDQQTAQDRQEEQAGGELSNWSAPPPANHEDAPPPPYKKNPYPDETAWGPPPERASTPAAPDERGLLSIDNHHDSDNGSSSNDNYNNGSSSNSNNYGISVQHDREQALTEKSAGGGPR